MAQAQTVFIGTPAAAIIAIIAGILILIFPRILNYIVGIYLVVVGILGLVYYFR